MFKFRLKNIGGYSLFELIVVIVIIGIIATVSLKSMRQTYDSIRVEETKKELDMLAQAIVGTHDLISGGNRTEFGYIGDIGSLPPNLSALVTNPGYATWDGPYINDKFYASVGGSESEYAYDGWGKAYTYSGGLTIISNGGSSTITREIAASTNILLNNSLSFNITDLDLTPPGDTYKDSVKFSYTYPNGTGSIATVEKYPTSNGLVQYNTLPIGQHTLKVIYIPDNDTLQRVIIIEPGQTNYQEINLNGNYW
ncbi:prepilin-type N-terminal cleavage/methylation domain-containing protein [Candidatus Zixiibacteriota bacterium]